MNIRQIPALTERDIARFHTKYVIHPYSGCHEWQGALHNGYGSFSIKGSAYAAHRVAYVLAKGEPEAGSVIDHMCRNRRCVNPDHARAISTQENIRIGLVGQHNRTKIVCPRGHALAGANLIPSLRWAGRACRACDVAARAARHKGLQGHEREVFIIKKAGHKYRELIAQSREEVAA